MNELLPWEGHSHDPNATVAIGNGLHIDGDDADDDSTHFARPALSPPLFSPMTATWQTDNGPQAESPGRANRPPNLQLQTPDPGFLQSSFSKSPIRSRFNEQPLSQPHASGDTQPHDDSLGRRPSLATSDRKDVEGPSRYDVSVSSDHLEEALVNEYVREGSQNSWLDPIDESGGSAASSVHSRTSSMGYRRRHIRSASGATEAEFDTALDAAIEAAYDEGYEPMTADELEDEPPNDEVVANAMRKVELARERVRQTEREAYAVANETERQRWFNHQTTGLICNDEPPGPTQGPHDFFDETSSDEEERQLDELTRNYHANSNGFHKQQLSNHRYIPRESDSSGFTSKTWHSSMGSNPPTTATSLSTVTESAMVPSPPRIPAPAVPPPTQALPDLPAPRSPSSAPSVRNRRLSGQNPKQLKIQTTSLSPPSSSHTNQLLDTGDHDSGQHHPISHRPSSPPIPNGNALEPRQLGSPFGHRAPDTEEGSIGRSASPSLNKLRKNFSSSSLKSLKNRNISLTNLDDIPSDVSPGTPVSTHWGASRVPAVPALPTPLTATLREKTDPSLSGGMHLLENSFHSLDTPGSPDQSSLDAPVPLEPCPIDFLLRPFWLMRCLYQTLVHPRGGYLSAKLFVPREAWRVKGVKLKNVEDKIANCDMLTAALLKLARVDTCDADAVLDEMQSLEAVLEQTQTTLTRKLGNEVGVSSTATLFREASGTGDSDIPSSNLPRSASVSGKSAFSWRRLRSKNSAAALGASTQARPAGADGPRDSSGASTLPMTTQPTSKPARRDVGLAQFTGPNSHYMSSLARLFDAAQALGKFHRL